MDQETWIVVANSTRARIFRLKTIDEIEEVDNIIHCGSRLREGELVSDRPGRVYDSFGGGRHAMEQELPPHKRTSQLFASEVSDYLKQALQDRRFQKLYIAAGPTF